jgi:CSLREA domain-containing protein
MSKRPVLIVATIIFCLSLVLLGGRARLSSTPQDSGGAKTISPTSNGGATLGATAADLQRGANGAGTISVSIPFSEIGARATAEYHGDGIGIHATSDGAELRTAFQKLSGTVNSEGLWLDSTEEKGGRLHLVASSIGRSDRSNFVPGMGSVAVTDKLVTLTRPGLIDEYSVSVDGVRQDFIVPERPAGTGELNLELKLSGARAEAGANGARLILAGSSRELAYGKLRVTDATGRALTARLEVISSGRLAVRVDDADAVYPVRIDPTFNDAAWVSMNSLADVAYTFSESGGATEWTNPAGWTPSYPGLTIESGHSAAIAANCTIQTSVPVTINGNLTVNANVQLLVNSGPLTLSSGSLFTNNGTFLTGGPAFNINSGATMTNNGDFSAGGTVIESGATLNNNTANSRLSFASGTITGDLTNGIGVVDLVGYDTNALTGNYDNGPGEMRIESFCGFGCFFGGPPNTGKLTVSGSATLSGTFDFEVPSVGFVTPPPPGAQFVVLDAAGGISGTFTNSFVDLSGGLRANISYTATQAIITIGLQPSQTFVVTKTADTDDGACDADCSLREAITAANATPTADTINFDIPTSDPGCNSGVGPCSILLGATPAPPGIGIGQLQIASSVTINGPTSPALPVIVDGQNANRVFLVSQGTSFVNNLTIAHAGTTGEFSSGGGFFVNGAATATVTGMTFRDNVVADAKGGGAGVNLGGTLNVINSTFSNNSALTGGALFNESGGTLNLLNVTVTNNTATGGGAGGLDTQNQTTSIRNSIIANNSVSNITGAFTDLGNNITSGDPLVGPLQDNGGPTFTRALQPGSPAIDAGDDCVLTDTCSTAYGFSLTTDQRGTTRPQSMHVDIGAYEETNVVAIYTLNYTAGANGSISGTTPQTVNSGSDGTAVTAVADAGYHFVDWSDSSTANPRTDTNVTTDISVTANFAINTYTLTYSAGPNGSISGITPQTVNHGTDGSEVTAVADAGYHFVDWSDSSTAHPRTDTNVTADISVTANFAINTYTLTYSAGPNGLISGITPQTVNHGTDGSEVTAVADAGYHFVNWTDTNQVAGGHSSTNAHQPALVSPNPRTDTNVTADISVTANFAINTYTATYTAGPNGSISGTTPQTVDHGADGTAVEAVPEIGYHFVDWSDASTANPRTDTNVTADINVTANFAIDTYTLTYNAGPNGSISGTTPQTVNHGTDGTEVTAVADAGYHFVDWSDSSTTNPRTDTNVTADISVTANFAFTPLNSNADLASLTLSDGTLTPDFAAETTDYTASVSNLASSITVTPTVGYTGNIGTSTASKRSIISPNAVPMGATVTVNGTPVASGTASDPIAITVGDNTITIVVTAEDQATTKTYTVIVNRTAGPEIAIEQPTGVDRTDGAATIGMGVVNAGGISERTFLVKNAGVAELTGLQVTIDGADEADFSVVTTPTTSLNSAEMTTFRIRFAPSSNGVKTASLHVASNDEDENPFDLTLTGTRTDSATGEALDFDGLDDVVTIPHDDALNAYPLTVEAWIKTDVNDDGQRGIVNKYLPGSQNGWNLFLLEGHVRAWYFHPGGQIRGSQFGMQSNVPVADGAWHHVAFVVDIDGGWLYVDGELSASQGWSGNPGSPTTTQPASIGLYPGSGSFGGQMDEVRIWNRSFTQPQIRARMGVEVPPSEPGLVGNYRLNQGLAGANNAAEITGSDAGPNTRDGALSGFTLDGAVSNWIAPGAFPAGTQRGDIDIEQPPGIALTDGVSTLGFTGSVGDSADKVFVVRQNGATPVVLGSLTIDGPNETEFSVVSPPALGRISYRYYRFVPAKLGPGNYGWHQLSEFEFWSGGVKLNGATASNPNGSGYCPACAVDGDVNTKFFDRYHAPLVFDFGAPVLVDSYRWATGDDSPDRDARRWRIEGSTDGNVWSVVDDRTATDFPVPDDRKTFLPFVTVPEVTLFTIRYSPVTSGPKLATLHVASDDPDENPFDIALSANNPEIAVEHLAGTPLVDGSASVSFGDVNTNASRKKTFTVRNTGADELTLAGITFDGTDAADFSVSTAPASLVASGSSTTFVIRFAPSSTGPKTAVLHLANNDADEGPFDITLTGTGLTPPVLADVAQQAFLKASNPGQSDSYGYTVAVSGDTVVIGAPNESSSATGVNGDQNNDDVPGSGAAYVLVRDGMGNWTQQAYLKASNTDLYDQFGSAVAISGDTIVVAAPYEASTATGVNGDESDNNTPYSGAAYVFTRTGTTWTQQAYLKASNTDAYDQFASAVGISGDTIVVAAPYEDSSATGFNGDQSNNDRESSGATYIFVRNEATWSQQAYLKASNPGQYDYFGYAVAISGDSVVVGAQGEASNVTGVNGDQSNNDASYSGAAYIFVRNESSWSQQAYLKASNTGAYDQFGSAVSISGDSVVVGSPYEDSSATGVNGDQSDNAGQNSGAAYIFVRAATDWTQQAYLKASNTEGGGMRSSGDTFGSSVAVAGDSTVIGARYEASSATGLNGDEEDNSAPYAGAAYLYLRGVTGWTFQSYLKASNAAQYAQFGYSVAVSGNTLVAGAPFDNSTTEGSGAAYIFTFAPATVNTAPTITATTGSSRRRGTAASNSTIATVSDTETAAGSLTVTATTVPPGMTVTNIVNTDGTVTADVAADCSATVGENNIVLEVSDGSLSATANLTVNVTDNTAPVLTYSNISVGNNGSTTNNPTAASDNGSITSFVVQDPGTYTGTISVDASGVVSISGAAPVGTHTIVIRATDDCTAFTDASFTLTINPPPSLNGTKTVGPGGDYDSLTGTNGLFAAINNSIVTSDIVANVTGDLTEDGTNALNQFTESGAGNYTLTIQPADGAPKTISGNVANGMIRFNGADRVTIDGRFAGAGRFLTFRNTDTSNETFTLTGDASNNTFRSCIIEGAAEFGSVFFIGAGSITGNDNNLITDNQIRDRSDSPGVPGTLILTQASSAPGGVRNSGNTISNNELFNFTETGITISQTTAGNQESWTISGNTIYQTGARIGFVTGIRFSSATGTNTISGNTIRDLKGSDGEIGISLAGVSNAVIERNRIYSISAGTLVQGIFYSVSPNGSATVVNNQITIVPAAAGNPQIFGIRESGGSNYQSNVYYNSVLIGGTANGTNSTWAYLRNPGTPSAHTSRNNIWFNNRTGGTGNHFAAGNQSANGTFSSDYNLFVGTGLTAADFMDSGTSSSGTPVSFATWQSSSGGDAHSQANNPGGDFTSAMFVNPTIGDLHIVAAGNPLVSNTGTNVSGITTDYDNETRSATTPDLGSDEFAVANSAPAITAATGLSRQQGTAASNSTIATVSDNETAAGALTVTATTVPAGMAITNIINTSGTITADVATDCSAATGDKTIVLQVSDGSLTANTNLIVNVIANTTPTLTYNTGSVAFGNATTINPATGPSDNGAIASIAVQSTATYTGTISVDNTTGVVSISNAGPVGSHTITIRATDNCAAFTDATFTLNVGGATISGHLSYADAGTPTKNVTMTLTAPSFSTQTTVTDTNGDYAFTGLPTGNNYTVTPAKTGDANGLESSDASNVARYVAGLDTATANQSIAADADGDGMITSLDAALIARYVAGLPDAGKVGTWKFVPASRTYPALGADQINQNFTAILIGDTSGNWTASLAAGGFENSVTTQLNQPDVSPAVTVSLANPTGAMGSNISLPITVGDLTGRGVKAYDLQVTFNAAILELLPTPYDTAGTLSSGMLITPNANNAGHLIISAFQATDLSGSGTLLNLRFKIIGQPGQTSSVNFEDYTDPNTIFHPGFRFNAETPAATTSNGSITVNGPTAVTVSLANLTGPMGSNISLPITVGDLTGRGVKAYDLQVTFNAAILELLPTPYDTAGTLSSGMLITPNANNPGHLIISAFQATDLSGSGTLLNLRFKIIGQPGQTSSVNFEDYTDPNTIFHPGFRFNAGTPAATTSNGSIHVNGPTAASSTVSGEIVDGEGKPVAGVAIRMAGTQNRLTITDHDGKYHFEEVETGGFYTVTPARANYAFSPGQRSFSQIGQHTDAVFSGSSTGSALNPLDTTEYFVRQQYLDFLGREPDEAGLNFWVNNIESCGDDAHCREVKRIDTSAAFFLSIEFQQTGYLVYRTYRSAYSEIAGTPVPLRLAEFKPDTAQIANGVIVNQTGWQDKLESNKQAFATEFVQRARFVSAYPTTMTPLEFVSRLFTNAGVTPSDSDLSAALAEFGSAATSADVSARARAQRRVAENSALVQQEFNQAFVLMQYFGYLKRDANSGPDTDFSGYSFWLNKLNTFDGSFQNAEMVKSFLVSSEYRGRFPR